jgi:hypothetical protein
MKRYRVLVTVMLAAMALVAGCTSSDDTADETTEAAPATTVAPVVTVAAAETAVATVEACSEAWNTHDPNAAAAFFAEGAVDTGLVVGSPEWEQRHALAEVQGWRQSITSDCEAIDGMVKCLATSEETLLGGKAGVAYTYELSYDFDNEGLITKVELECREGCDDGQAFEVALGRWMAIAHPESYETLFVAESETRNEENWSTTEGMAELSPLIDEFVAQSDGYPLSGPSSTTELDAEVGQAFLEALGEGRWAEAESLSSGRANRYVHYLNVANRVAPERFSGHVSDVDVTTGQVVFHYDDGTSITYNDVSTEAGLVVNFKRNGSRIGSWPEPGSPGEAGDVTVTLTTAIGRAIRFDKTADPHPIYGEHTEAAATDVAVVTFLTIEVDNASTQEVDGWSAVLVTPDGRSAEVTDALSGSYPANAITDDVLIFTRLGLFEGAELRIRIDADTEVVVEIPAHE